MYLLEYDNHLQRILKSTKAIMLLSFIVISNYYLPLLLIYIVLFIFIRQTVIHLEHSLITST